MTNADRITIASELIRRAERIRAMAEEDCRDGYSATAADRLRDEQRDLLAQAEMHLALVEANQGRAA